MDVQRSAAVETAKAEAFTAALENDKASSCKLHSAHRSQSFDSSQWVKEYVQQQAELKAEGLAPELHHRDLTPKEIPFQCELYMEKPPSATVDFSHQHKLGVNREVTDTGVNADRLNPSKQHLPKREVVTPNYTYSQQPSDQTYPPSRTHQHVDSQLSAVQRHTYQHDNTSPHVQPSYAYHHVAAQQANSGKQQNMMDFVKFMARCELVTIGLLQFDECPGNYRAWKVSFFNATSDLSLTANEEMDLLVKWLGPESAAQVKRIRAVNVNILVKGLQMIWECLNECYGAPEVIENSLLERVDSFPKFSNKDNKKLRQLGDLLTELQAAKSEGALSGLAYLDTARGISGIVQKLPFSVQEKCMLLGYAYRAAQGCFPTILSSRLLYPSASKDAQ